MKVRIIIEYEPDVDHENISDSEMREVAYKELADWKGGHVNLQDMVDEPSIAITVEFDR